MPDDKARSDPAPNRRERMTTNRLSTLGLRSVLIAVVFAGGASVAVADSEWVYVKEGVAGKGWYSKQYRQYQQYPCFFRFVRKAWL